MMECSLKERNKNKIGSIILDALLSEEIVNTVVLNIINDNTLNIEDTDNIQTLSIALHTLYVSRDTALLNNIQTEDDIEIDKFLNNTPSETAIVGNLIKFIQELQNPKEKLKAVRTVSTIINTDEDSFNDEGSIATTFFKDSASANLRLLQQFRNILVDQVLFYSVDDKVFLVKNDEINGNLKTYRDSLKGRAESFDFDIQEGTLNTWMRDEEFDKVDHYIDTIMYEYFDDLMEVYGTGIIKVLEANKNNYSADNKYELAQAVNAAVPFKGGNIKIEKVIPQAFKLLVASTPLLDKEDKPIGEYIKYTAELLKLMDRLDYTRLDVNDIKQALEKAIRVNNREYNELDKQVLRGIYNRFYKEGTLIDKNSDVITLMTNQMALQPVAYSFLEYKDKEFKMRTTQTGGLTATSNVEQTVEVFEITKPYTSDEKTITTELGKFNPNAIDRKVVEKLDWERITNALFDYTGLDFRISEKRKYEMLSTIDNKEAIVRYIYQAIKQSKTEGVLSTQAIDGFSILVSIEARLNGDYFKSTVANLEGNTNNALSMHNLLVNFKRQNREIKKSIEQSKKDGVLSVFDSNPFIQDESLLEGFVIRSSIRKNDKVLSPSNFTVLDSLNYSINYGYFQMKKKGKALFDITTYADKGNNSLALISPKGKYADLFDLSYQETQDLHYSTISEYYTNLEKRILADFNSILDTKVRSISGLNTKLKQYTEEELSKLASDKGIDLIQNLMYEKVEGQLRFPKLLQDHINMYKDREAYNEYMLSNAKLFIQQLKKENYVLPSNKRLSKNEINSLEDINDDILKYFFDWNFISENIMNITVGSIFGHKAKTPFDMWIKQTKRNVALPATVHRYVLGLRNGVEDNMVVAMVEDPTRVLYNELGNEHKQETADGSMWSLPSALIKAQNSLGGVLGQQAGIHHKPIYSDLNHINGAFKFTKTADFRLTNWRIRNSTNDSDKISIHRLVKKMMSNKIGKDLSIKNLGIPIMIEGNIKHIVAIESVYGIGERKFSDGTTDNVAMDTMYDLWQSLGGENSMSVITQKAIKKHRVGNTHYKYSDSSWEALVEVEARNQEIKGNYTSKIILVSSQKVGVTNVNKKETLYNDTPFNTTTVSNYNGGIQLNAEHKTDNSDLTSPTQFISALIFGMLTADNALDVYSTLNKLAELDTEDLLNSAKGEQNELVETVFKELKKNYERNGDTTSQAYRYIAQYNDNPNLSIDNRLIFNKAIINLSNLFTEKGIRNRFSGLVAVISPGDDSLLLHTLPKGTLYIDSRGEQYYLKEDLIVGEEGAKKWREINTLHFENEELETKETLSSIKEYHTNNSKIEKLEQEIKIESAKVKNEITESEWNDLSEEVKNKLVECHG